MYYQESGIRNHLFEEIYNTCNLQKDTHINVGFWLLEKLCLEETHINQYKNEEDVCNAVMVR